MKRTLGTNGAEVSALGMGCWAIGGPFLLDGKPDGWGDIDDAESVRAVHRALELGVNFFDTADVYGTGHSERILGRALKGQRERVVIASKFGYTYDEAARVVAGTNTAPIYIRRACEASLRRLETDHLDLYQLHVGDVALEHIGGVWATLDKLKEEGLIGAYGWSTGDPERARALAEGSSGTALQFPANVFHDAEAIFGVCTEYGLASIVNSPLAMGLLSGKFHRDSRLPSDDVRGSGHTWVAYFEDGRPRPEFLERLEAVREVLTSGGRTLAQGALAWLWARNPTTVPIPGFRTVAQVEENAGALAYGPLTPAQMAEVERLLGR